jgi:hypothetical protein
MCHCDRGTARQVSGVMQITLRVTDCTSCPMSLVRKITDLRLYLPEQKIIKYHIVGTSLHIPLELHLEAG